MFINPKVDFIDASGKKDEFFCSICRFPLITARDFKYNSDFFCCHECFLTFAESRQDSWKEGYRPDKTTIEEYIYSRKKMFANQLSKEQK